MFKTVQTGMFFTSAINSLDDYTDTVTPYNSFCEDKEELGADYLNEPKESGGSDFVPLLHHRVLSQAALSGGQTFLTAHWGPVMCQPASRPQPSYQPPKTQGSLDEFHETGHDSQTNSTGSPQGCVIVL